ncbi:cytoplasmic [NiFe]-hydrogenase, large subunit [Citrifermentans bemidjiense Bem]|uniref:Cytoplasmic [NiFe]-hydrogenase, large subunit n=1 Tax=Citrifermentans bemidjiense (strain ATCC BAA-1014 / DSM 16622 / JCM 12645 / Bem) TaxID=404380 RepID=B5EBV8_CITBB|nr:nickel-dependent hydrogenase large subunit [Citrifermentans bemidjiense]ACH38982.1 cytoplasmic [NiFe]-hydrogenase, large subunit [Citrifermentans bemidjiense Bem]
MGSVVELNLTRVEGHGSVKVYREGSRVERVELCLTDSPRLFEALLVGKSYLEVPEIVCRICSLCSTVHKVTALLAVENAFGVEVSGATALTRELIMQGGMIQDHALHLYCLLLPDLLGVPGVTGLAQKAPELLKAGLSIKRVGNMIQETVGGRLIHSVNIRLGGLGQRVGKKELLRLRHELESVLPACRDAYRLFRTPFPFPELPSPNALAVDPCGAGRSAAIRCRMGGGESFAVSGYREAIKESVLPHSNAKYSKVMGKEATVGALARLSLGVRLRAQAQGVFDEVKHEILGRDIRGNSLAQAIELCDAAERAIELIDRLVEEGQGPPDDVGPVLRAGRGSAACEAPRGLLIHSYGFDSNGICTEADVVTPTALNQGAMARDLLALARGMEGEETKKMTTALERLIRCYDPCISCAVHVLKL